MFSTKLLASVLLVLAVMFAQVGNVAAAPQTQDTTPISGTVQTIKTETDANGVTTVLVTLLLADQTTQTVRISTAYALELGLLDATTQQPVPPENLPPNGVTIDPAQVIPDPATTQESVHPIAWLLAEFFKEDPSVVEGYHEDGFGFGVIAQSLWMSKNLAGDATLAKQILDAKQSGDYSQIKFSDGTPITFPGDTVPTNWGQFKKALSEKKNNLGYIVSGHADQDNSTDPVLTQQHDNGKDKHNQDNPGKGKDKIKKHP